VEHTQEVARISGGTVGKATQVAISIPKLKIFKKRRIFKNNVEYIK